MHQRHLLALGLLGLVACISPTHGDEPARAETTATAAVSKTRGGDRADTIKTLQNLGTLIGEWKGVAQPKRGSSAGAWSEKAQAAWNFEGNASTLLMSFEPGQQFHKAAFAVAGDRTTPILTLHPLKGDAQVLSRIVNEQEVRRENELWVFESAADRFPQTRCTVRIISDIRVTLLFEEKSAELGAFRRLSEIGMTRAGARLAGGNTGERQCIVTGGLGTIKVSYEGKVFYVCCEGCRQAFDADPKGTLDAYRQRLKTEAAVKSP